MVETSLLRWIVLLPAVAAGIHGVSLVLLRREAPRDFVVTVSCGAVLLSFVLSCAALLKLVGLPPGERFLADNVFTWIGSGRFSAEFAFQLDPLSSVMILVVTGVGSLIHIWRRALLLSSDRVLVQRPLERLLRHQGVHREPNRRLRIPDRDAPARVDSGGPRLRGPELP
jgi:hypothetical protein